MYKKLYNGVIPKIGLEVHAQLNLRSKLFSHGRNELKNPNHKLDLLDLAIPGSLPKLNREALRSALLTCIGLNCSIPELISFERKNYFYTDMPAGYQITQQERPIGLNGFVEFITTTYQKSIISHSQPYDLVRYLFFDSRKELGEIEPYLRRSKIKQIQLEQDSAKTLSNIDDESNSDETYSLVDYNRSGAGLMEIVFEPDLTNHHEASSLIRELIILLQSLDTCDCQLQTGSLRVDANVSLQTIPGLPIENSPKVELKNLNSLGFLNMAILSEINRQVGLYKDGKTVEQETRYYDHKLNRTKPLRLKEDAIDYRFVPEPNIPPIRLEQDFVNVVRSQIPSRLPTETRKVLKDTYNLSLTFIAEVMETPGLSEYFMQVMDGSNKLDPDIIADFLIYTINNLKSVVGPRLSIDMKPDGVFRRRLSPEKMRDIIDLLKDDKISYTIAYELIKYIVVNNDDSQPEDILRHFDWFQINDPAKIQEFCDEIISKMVNTPKKYAKRGSLKDLRRLLEKVGQVSGHRISTRKAMEYFNSRLRPGQ